MKKILSKIGAGFLGAVMTGASLLVPVAIADSTANTLADYPAPFITDGGTDMLMVIGADASPKDVLGAINIAVELGGEPEGEPVPTGAATTAVTGGEDKEISLADSDLGDFGTLKDNYLAGFKDKKITWNGEDIDIEETLSLDGLSILTSADDKNVGSDVYLGTTTNPENFIYEYIIDDNDFNASVVADSSSEKLTIELLGETMIVTDIDVAADKIKFKFADDVVLGMGESTTVTADSTEYTITVNSIGTRSVSVSVNGDTQIIEDDHNYDFGTVTVEVGSILYTDDTESRQTKLSVGSDITKTVSSGDSMEVFDEPKEAKDAEWVWHVDANETNVEIGARYSLDSRKLDDDIAPKAVGEKIELPNGYGEVELSELTAVADLKYTFEFKEGNIDVYNVSTPSDRLYDNRNALMISSGEADTGFKIDSKETDTVYLFEGNDTTLIVGLAYEDGDNNIVMSAAPNTSESFILDNDKNIYNATYNASNSTNVDLNLTNLLSGLNEEVGIDVNVHSVKLGSNEGDADADEIKVTEQGASATAIGTYDKSYRTYSGAIIETPEDNGDNDEVVMYIPEEQIKAKVIVSGPGTEVTTTEGDTVTPKVEPVRDNIARMDTDEGIQSDKVNKNLILVGSPAVNRLTAAVLGVDYPTYGSQWTADENLSAKVPISGEGSAMIKMVNNAFGGGNVALVVAGWSADDTQAACTALQQFKKEEYGTYDLTKENVTVSETTVKLID